MSDLTAEKLREILSYDPETGVMRWRVKYARCLRPGAVAGCIDRFGSGYRRIRIDRKGYSEHRLVWMYVHGSWPTEVIDHINGDRSDNRLSNLREASWAQNQQNRNGTQKNNTSGVRGVSWDKTNNKWLAAIEFRGRHIHLGRFENIECAASARKAAELKLFTHTPLAMEA